MASHLALVSPLVMGALTLLAVLAIRSAGWYDYEPQLRREETNLLSAVANDPVAWVIAFFLLILLAVGATLSALSGGGTALFLALAGVLVFGLLTIGVYAAGRARGHPHAYAVGEVVITIGFLALIAIAARLLTNFSG